MRALGLTRAAPAVAALPLLLGGCAADPQDAGLTPADPEPSQERESATQGSAEAAEPTGDPLTFASDGGKIVISCFPDGARRLMIFDQVEADRRVTLRGLTTDAEALRVGRAFVAPLPRRSVPASGLLDLDADGASIDDLEGWSERERLRGHTLEPGRGYTFFARVRAVADRTLDDLELAWDDGSTTGTSAYDLNGGTRSGGC